MYIVRCVHERVRFALLVAGRDEQFDGNRFDDVQSGVGGHNAAKMGLRESGLNTIQNQRSVSVRLQ